MWYRAEYKPFAEEKKRTRGNLKTAEPIAFREIVEHYPRYYFADEIVTIRDRRDFSDRLSKPRHSLAAAFIKEPSFVPARGIVHGYDETANTAAIDVESSGKAFLVMSVTPHKYWRVTIDGRRVKPIVTNIGYQGIVVPAGRHRVEMRYRNDLIAHGVKISIAAVVLLGAAAVLSRRRTPWPH
jgi:hypothetical protein